MDEFKNEIVRVVSKKFSIAESMLEVPPDSSLGDFALPCFGFAKQLKKKPQDIAKELAKELVPTPLIKEIKAVGPYVNFFVKKEKMAEIVFNDILKLKNDFGKSLIGRDKTVMIEFSSPNTNKPLHLGHIRNNLIGMSLANIFDACGYKAVKANLINDRGIHICQSMLAYKKWGENKEPDKKPDHFVGDFYVLFHKRAAENPELENEAYDMLKRWESGDKEVVALWKKMNNWVYRGFDETYTMLGTKFDVNYYESEIYEKGKKAVMDAFEKGTLKKHTDGCIIADLEKFGLPNKTLLRADGTSIYATQDIYLAKLKFEQYNLDKSIYVAGSEHDLYFQQLFKILELLGFNFTGKLHHLSYGMVYLPEGKMKSREGTVIDADDIMKEMIELSAADLKKRYGAMAEKELNNRAKAIGLGALKFFMLKYDPSKDINYNPSESISFEGETGPYVQYAYARISSILERYGKSVDKDVDLSLLKAKEENELIKMLAKFPESVEDAARSYKPSLVVRYLLELAQKFNEFYQLHQVLNADDENLKKARILLISCIRQVLKNGLTMLGIECLDKM